MLSLSDESSSRLFQYTLLLSSLPLLAITLNVVRQLIQPRDKSLPPEIFHWIPFVGSAIEYGNDPIKFFFKCQQKYGDIFTFVLFGRKVTVALGAKGNDFVLGGKHANLSAEDAYAHLTTPVFGKDVIHDVPNEIFMQQKKFVKAGLTTESFRAYVGMIEDEVSNFMDRDPSFRTYQAVAPEVDNWGRFDAHKVMAQMTILTASRTLQGREVRSGLDKTFAQLYEDLDGGFKPINFLFPNLPLESYRKRDHAQQKMTEFYLDIINKRKTGISPSDDTDMISVLCNQSYRDGRTLPDHEVAHLMIALLMAGQHTSATSGSWVLLRLAANPDVAEALYKEQVQHFSNDDGTLRSPIYEELKALPILDSVIRESLRVHPPIHSVMRYVRANIPVPTALAAPSEDGIYVVPKGHHVLASPAFSQVDPRVWRDSEKWDPSRWMDKDGQAQNALRSSDEGDTPGKGVSRGTESPYQPFGAGKHRCIGEQFAYLQLGTVISTIVRKIEMRLPTSFPKNNYHTLITSPSEPRMISYRRRRLA
ncbi:lanosterol 14-alpha-demethylase [Stereum hirsutum FP-91666 SS1]|uniref:lanosterol 14-alpha-demethylase n=1 Tax=Stereum hirsutum (strain FP-91666) TaxID=721885 RepID=UPI000444A45C|nr:lanosterol 14-alpha-demethylase [Stereum hirsutum FP-91666 SS1]EIM85210.1 lanosterol 14-alpha-demethylase [Stereum hirsutum FP-91666 SS1]